MELLPSDASDSECGEEDALECDAEVGSEVDLQPSATSDSASGGEEDEEDPNDLQRERDAAFDATAHPNVFSCDHCGDVAEWTNGCCPACGKGVDGEEQAEMEEEVEVAAATDAAVAAEERRLLRISKRRERRKRMPRSAVPRPPRKWVWYLLKQMTKGCMPFANEQNTHADAVFKQGYSGRGAQFRADELSHGGFRFGVVFEQEIVFASDISEKDQKRHMEDVEDAYLEATKAQYCIDSLEGDEYRVMPRDQGEAIACDALKRARHLYGSV